MKEEVRQALSTAFQSWVKDNPSAGESSAITVETPPGNVGADLASNLPMSVAKKVGKNPRQVAQEILSRLPVGVVARGEIAGPGFLNFHLSDVWLTGELRTLLLKRET
jgi:arginyl-tRNA synthetase